MLDPWCFKLFTRTWLFGNMLGLGHEGTEGGQSHTHMAVTQTTGTKMDCPGKWKHGPKPACSVLLFDSSHTS